ncbi:MAG: hypothetical protein ACJ79Q_09545, partial [Gemmatimonadaceae bacterium]
MLEHRNDKSDNLDRPSRGGPRSSRSLIEQARDAERRGDTARSLGLYDDAIEALEREQNLALLADALRWKGTVHREQGETEAAYRCYTQSLIMAERSNSVSGKAHGYNCLAIIAQRRGILTESERLYGQAADFAGRAGDVRLLGMTGASAPLGRWRV